MSTSTTNPVPALRTPDGQNTLRAAACMCAAMFAAASIDVSAKALAESYSTAQIVFLRSLIAMPFVLALVHVQVGLAALTTAGWGWQTWRGLLTAGANFGFFYGLAHVPLVQALMLAYISPVLIVLLARPLLGESIGVARLLGVLIGFAGVLFVVSQDVGSDLGPGASEFTLGDIHPAVLAILGSALCWALLSISNRRLAGQVSTPVLTFYTYPVSLVIATVWTVEAWITPTTVLDWTLFATAALGSALAHWLAAMAYRYADASFVAPFEYTALIWISLAGFVFWQEVPSWPIIAGGVAVILGGYIALQGRG